MIFSEAAIRVGASVTPSIGSTSSAERAGRSLLQLLERHAEAVEQRARAVGDVEAGLARRPSRCSSGAIFTSALSPIFGIDAWPATPSVIRRKRKTPFSATQTPCTRRPSYGMTAPGALVEQVVAAHEVGAVLADPLRALGAAGLLVDDADDEQVALGRPPALLARAGSPRRPRRRSATSCPARRGPRRSRRRGRPTTGRAATPPASRRRCRRGESRQSVGPSAWPRRRATRFGRSSVRPASSTSKPAALSRPARCSCAGALVPRRVDGVEADQALQERDGLGHPPQDKGVRPFR